MGSKFGAETGAAIKDAVDGAKEKVLLKRDLITGAALAGGAVYGGKRGYKEDTLDRDVRQSLGLKEKEDWLSKNKGALIGGAASLAGGIGGRYLAKKSGLALGGLGTLAGIGIGSRIAGDVANKYVRQSNRRQIEKELQNKQQSNFNNMYGETRQFNKVTDFLKNNPKSVGAAAGAVLGGGIGYMVDRKAKREGNFIKRNAGLAAGLAAGAGLGLAGGAYGPGLIAKIAKKKTVGESNYTDQLDPRMYSFWKNNKNALIAGGIGLGVGALGGIVKQRKKSNRAKIKGALVGAGIGAAAGFGGAKAVGLFNRNHSAFTPGTVAQLAGTIGGAGLNTYLAKKEADKWGLEGADRRNLMIRRGLKGAALGTLAGGAVGAGLSFGGVKKSALEGKVPAFNTFDRVSGTIGNASILGGIAGRFVGRDVRKRINDAEKLQKYGQDPNAVAGINVKSQSDTNMTAPKMGESVSDVKLAQRIKNAAKSTGQFLGNNWIGGASGAAALGAGGAYLGGKVAQRRGGNVTKGRVVGGALGAIGGYAAGAGVQAGINALRNRG